MWELRLVREVGEGYLSLGFSKCVVEVSQLRLRFEEEGARRGLFEVGYRGSIWWFFFF